MTVKELCDACGFEMVVGAEFEDRQVNGAYACDLLSWVIGRAKENAAFITVMTNMNVIAVAIMAELSCVIVTEGAQPDEHAVAKAKQNEVFLLKSSLPTYETCLIVSSKLGGKAG